MQTIAQRKMMIYINFCIKICKEILPLQRKTLKKREQGFNKLSFQ